MPFRRRSSLSPINSIKHIVDTSGGLTGGATSVSVIAKTVPNVDSTTFVPGDIRLGGKVNAFFISVFVLGGTGSTLNGPIDWHLIKQYSGQGGASIPTPGQTGTSDLRNQIIHEEKGLAGSGDGTPMAFKGVIVIPRGMRTMRTGEQWVIRIVSADATSDAQFCVKAIYKSFF